ncbi:hypothetical protein ACNQR7_31265 [Mycolicibacterium senegalense]|uniref:hypothetical protein n=1 Tax=Mycolicibacterium senegalense TaxID=1796 RepID=UPI003AAF5DE0
MIDGTRAHSNADLAGRRMMSPLSAASPLGGACASATYEVSEAVNTQVTLADGSVCYQPSRTRLSRWSGWIFLGLTVAVTAITFVATVIVGTTTVGQYVATWFGTVFVAGMFAGLSQMLH